MKAQRRQELKTNELAETLRQAKEFLERYATYVTGGAIVVAVILIGSLWYRSSLTAGHRRQWEDYYSLEQASVQLVFGQVGAPQAPGGEDFDTLVARHKTLVSSVNDPLVRLRTLEALGDFCWMYALRGPGGIGSGSETSARALEECAAAYEQIKRDFPDDAWAAGNAMMALAVIAEERGDFDRAKEIYGQIESDQSYAETTLVDYAKEALARVDELREPIVFAPAAPPPAAAGAAGPTPAPAATASPPPESEPVEVPSAAAPTAPEGGRPASSEGTSPSPAASESPAPEQTEPSEDPAQPSPDAEAPQPSAAAEGDPAAP